MDPKTTRCLRSVLWRRMDTAGCEYFELRESASGPVLSGSVVLEEEGAPLLVEYTLTCDSRWHTREARILQRHGGVEQVLTLRVDAEQRWWRGDEEVPQFRGLIDIDLSCTPSTNLLPIRRLALEPGQGQDVTAAWVRFPAMELLPLPQRYTRTGPHHYRYESRGGRFTAALETDELGLVLNYPPGWERAASTKP